MSLWTYVQGVIEVTSIGRTQEQKDMTLKATLRHLPEVTGSEGGMEVYVNRMRGHDQSSSHDELDVWQNGYGYEIQSGYLLTIDASLRDREFPQTMRELLKWLFRLAKRTMVDSVFVNVRGWDGDEYKRVVINTHEKDDSGWTDLYDESWLSEYIRTTFDYWLKEDNEDEHDD